MSSKYLFVGTFKSGELKRDSAAVIPFLTSKVFYSLRDDYVLSTFGGTFLETFFYQLLGAASWLVVL